MGELLDSFVKKLKEMGLDNDPMGALLIEIATEHANDPQFEFLVQRFSTEIPFCTCDYYQTHPGLHNEQCPIRSLFIHSNVDIAH